MRRIQLSRFYQRGLVCGLAWLAAAAAAEDRVDQGLYGEFAPVLTASRILQSPLDAPAPVTVIDRETIEDSGFTEIHDIFRLVPGFLVADWPKGSPIVVNQGLGDARSRRMLILLDGRALYDPYKGGVEWQDLPLRLDDIERIEVVRGPNSASYGANAFQGVINIITRVPIGERETGVTVRAGQHDIGDLYAYMTRGDGVLNWRLSASSRQASNYRDLDLPVQQYNEAIRRRVLNAQLAWTPRADEEVGLRLGLTEGENDIGQPGDSASPPRAADLRDLFLDLGWKRFYAENSEISLRYYHYGRTGHDRYTVYPMDPGIAPMPSLSLQNDVAVLRDDLEFQQIHAWSDTLSGLWGLGLRHDAAESPSGLAGLGSVGGWQWQVFGNVDWRVAPDWLLHAGAMLERHYNTGALFAPRLALNYRLTPSQSLRFSIGRAYRAPTIFEAQAREMVVWSGGVAEVDHYAYRDLSPEKLDYVELGYMAYLRPRGLRVDARMYWNAYDNFIDEQSCILDGNYAGPACPFPDPAGYERPEGYAGKPYDTGLPSRYGHYKAFYFFNAGNIQVHGGDVSLDWAHPRWGRFRANHALTWIRASGVGADLALDPTAITKDVDFEQSAPRRATTLLWSKRFAGGLRASLAGYRVGAMKWPNDGDTQAAYRRYDAVLGKRLSLLGNEDELAFTVQGFNAEHAEFRGAYLVERRAFVSYRARF